MDQLRKRQRTQLLFQYNHLLIRAAYRTPDMHKHLASHLLIAPDGELVCNVAGESFRTKGVFIASDVEHTAYVEDGDMLLFLFVETSSSAKEIEEKYLTGNSYRIITDELVKETQNVYASYQLNLPELDTRILKVFHICAQEYSIFDERIEQVLNVLRDMETIETNIADQLCKETALSKSRLSHLFRQEAGITLKQYLMLEKMRKMYEYFETTGSITAASLKAGFDSPSHAAATYKRMFGLSFSDYNKSTK